VILASGDRVAYPPLPSGVVCPSNLTWDPQEASVGQLGSHAGMNIWFECVFHPLTPAQCRVTQFIDHPAVFHQSRKLNQLARALRSVCSRAGIEAKAPCTRLALRKAVARGSLRLLPVVRAAVDKIKANFIAANRLGDHYAAFQIRRGDK
jgi:hypothetical protein